MTVRNLDRLFRPRSVTIVGASDTPGTLGYVLAGNALSSCFTGNISLVNPKYSTVMGHACLPDIAQLPSAPDLAVITTPARVVPLTISNLAKRGTKAAIIISSGFGSTAGTTYKAEIQQATKPYLMRIVGPNCLGVLMPGIGLNASFAHLTPAKGSIAFLAQSGAILTSALDWASAHGIGFSYLVSMGEMLDVDFGDMLDYLAADADTSAILIYAEAVTNARKFVSAARRAARLKPVIIIKSGRHGETARAVASHTGALAGSDAVYDAVFLRTGILRVDSLSELFSAMQTLALVGPIKGERLAIVTNGGGAGILAADALVTDGGKLAPLAAETVELLDRTLPVGWSRQNPVDIVGDADADRYRNSVDILSKSPDSDALMVLNSPTAVTSAAAAAEAVIAGAHGSKKPLLTAWIGEYTSHAARDRFAAAKIPSYATPEQATHAFMHLVRYSRNQSLLTETPPSLPPHFQPQRQVARAIIDEALKNERDFLTAPESMSILKAYGITVVESVVACSPEEAGDAMVRLDAPVVLKVLSPDITHKTDVGGVALNLRSRGDVEIAARQMIRNIQQKWPEARLDGFSVSPMIDRGAGYELIIGSVVDPQFGPVIVFGQGGTAVELVADCAIGLPPLNLKLANELVANTRISKLLAGHRGMPATDVAGVAFAIVGVSQLIADFAEIVELDVNPLLAKSDSVMALDARIRVTATEALPTQRLAIKPYPTELEERINLANGRSYLMRPVRPEDEAAFQIAFRHLSPESLRLRFFRAITNPSHKEIAALTQIDYDREMAFVLMDNFQSEVYADARLMMDPDRLTAEFAIIVRDDVSGQGIGSLLIKRLLSYARHLGVATIYGNVLAQNVRMLSLCRKSGFKLETATSAPGVVSVSQDL